MSSHRTLCHESPPSRDLRHYSVMHPPASPALALQARGEANSSRRPTLPNPDIRVLSKSPPQDLAFSEDRRNSLRSTLHERVNSRSIRRRASQSSLKTKPSAASRSVSRRNVCLQIPDPGHLDLSSDLSVPSQGDYFSALPPTPPDDGDHVAWDTLSRMFLFETHANRDPILASCPVDEGPSRRIASNVSPDSITSPSALSHPSSSSSGESSTGEAMDCGRDSWPENGIEAVVSSLAVSNSRGDPVKIVAQTLPYPHAEDKSVALPVQNIFSAIVQAVQNRTRQGQSPYIHITHAVPEQFNLSNLPSSPPNTPRCHSPRDDYFNSTVFSSAAVVSAYHDFRGSVQTQPSHSPMPVVPPYSVHISVLERYLPPPSPQEYKDLFLPDRPSFLVDRLFELSPNGGSLLFIYPTKRGANTFKTQYLGPILDPLLRQLVVVNELSADVGRHLGKFSPVSQMDDFDAMRSRVIQLCHTLSSPKSQFSLAESGKGCVCIERSLWAEWYIHQERSRLKEALSMYWRNNRRPSATNIGFNPRAHGQDKEVTSAMLLADILDGIRRRPYESEPQGGVELGVFVIRRSR